MHIAVKNPIGAPTDKDMSNAQGRNAAAASAGVLDGMRDETSAALVTRISSRPRAGGEVEMPWLVKPCRRLMVLLVVLRPRVGRPTLLVDRYQRTRHMRAEVPATRRRLDRA